MRDKYIFGICSAYLFTLSYFEFVEPLNFDYFKLLEWVVQLEELILMCFLS